MLARKVGALLLIATAVVEVGATIAGTDPEQARAYLRESLELSTALGYQSARDLVWAAGIASALNDRTTTLELARSAIRGLQWSGDRLRLGITLHRWRAHWLAGPRLPRSSSSPKPMPSESARTAQLINSTVIAALGKQRTRELCARGADMDWDQAVDCTPHPDHPGPQRTPIRGPAGSSGSGSSFQLTRRSSMAQEGKRVDAGARLGNYRLPIRGRWDSSGCWAAWVRAEWARCSWAARLGKVQVAVKVISPELAVRPVARSTGSPARSLRPAR